MKPNQKLVQLPGFGTDLYAQPAIHHENVEPRSIVHQAHMVYFTDSSSSRRLDSGQDISTDSAASNTRKFAAPELYSPDGITIRRSSQTDV